MQPGFSLSDEGLGGVLWSLCCLHLKGKWETSLLKVTKLLLASGSETQMSTPGPSLGTMFGGALGGKIVFWKVCWSF